jgi:hypothetical protein
MPTHLRSLVATGLALGCAVLAVPADARAGERGAGGTVGYDVSHPQCGTRLPAERAFAVVGVNGGIATTQNECLTEQWEWATGASGAVAGQPPAQLYVNTANPGEVRDEVTTWPDDGRNRYGTCDGSNSAACSYEYGQQRAAAQVGMVLTGLGQSDDGAEDGADDGRDLAAEPAVPATFDGVEELAGLRWWLDVETMNTWQTDGEDPRRNNRAALEGMADHFASVGGRVGVYSSGRQWEQIVGTVPSSSSLYELDSWLAGALSLAGAVANCSDPPLVNGGRVVLTQYVVADLDHDHACTPGGPGRGPRAGG